MSGFPQPPPDVVAALAKENRSPQVIGITAAFTGLAFVCVVLRFFTRIKIVGIVGMEDYLMALSMLFSIFTSTCLIQGARYGNGKHLINVPLENGTYVLQYLFFGILAYHVSLTSTKLSILLQYRRIFTLKDSRKPIYIAMGICTACGITAIVSATFTCVPVDAYWDMMKKPFAKCVNQDAMYHANAGLNIATDLLVAALPIRSLWTLQIPMRQKVAVVMLLTLGWFVVIISVLRLHFLILVAKHPTDQTWYSAPAAYWSALEVNLAIVCASTPALKPLIVRMVPVFGTRFGTKQSNLKHQTSRSQTMGTHNSRTNGNFMRLKGKPSQSSLGDDIHHEHGVTALQHAGGIQVTRDFEQRSLNDDGISDDSRKDLYNGFPQPRRAI